MTLSLNGIRASSVRRLTPWAGAWQADVDLDLGPLKDLPTAPGPAVLLVGDGVLTGRIDPARSGRFGARARARVVAGAGGWERDVPAKAYHNDAGVLSTAVLATTAAEVGETVVEASPSRLGVDYVRSAGPAASVLLGLPWYVDATGTTIVGPRPRTPASSSVRVLAWDARNRVATLATDELVEPGTILIDDRFGTAVIRDVEQTWGDGGARAIAWTMAADATPASAIAGGELVTTIAEIARQASGAAHLRTFRYRVVSQGPDGRFTLQAVRKAAGVPDLRAISLAPAVPGMSVKVAPGTIARVGFLDGERTAPVVLGFESGPVPLEVTFDTTIAKVGGAAVLPVALATPTTTAINALKTAVVALCAAVPGMATVSATLETAVSGAVASVPSTKLRAE